MRHPSAPCTRDDAGWRALWALLGASTGFADFYLRHPEELAHLAGAGAALPTAEELRTALLASVGADDGFAADASDASWVALRVRYRRLLARDRGLRPAERTRPVDEIAVVSARSRTRRARRSRHRCAWRAPGCRPAAAGAGLFPRDQVAAHPARDHRDGQDRRAGAQLRERRRRDLRRRARTRI